MAVGAALAMFAASMIILQLPAHKKPTVRQVVGRLGLAAIASLPVGAVAADVLHASPKLIYSACALSGIFGERVFVAIERFGKKYGIDLSETENDGAGKGEPDA